jgi:hypothetical protein
LDQETTPATEVANGITEEQAASELLKKWGVDETSTQAEPEEEGETEEAVEATAEVEDEPEEEAEESGEIEIDVAGEKFKLPAKLKEHAEKIQAKAKEVEAGATRKFQEAADLRKAVEAKAQQVEQLQQIAHQNADLLADHKWISNRLAQYEQVDVARLSVEDPAQLARINAEFNQLQAAKSRVEQAYQQRVGYFNQTKQAMEAERLKALDDFASKHVKDWGTDKGNRLKEYALKTGYSPEQLHASLSPEFIRLLDDAEYGARVRTAKPQKQTEPSKTLKPGSVTSAKPASVHKAQQAFQRLGKTGSVDDAAMALLARSNIRKK